MTDANVNTRTESDVPQRSARHIKFLWLRPLSRIAIGSTEKQKHLLALWYFKRSNLNGARGRAEEGLHRRFPPQDLIEGGFEERAVGTHALPLLWMRGEGENGIGKSIDRRVEPCCQERAHKDGCFFGGDFTGIVRRPDVCSKSHIGACAAGALRMDPGQYRLSGLRRGLEDVVAGTKRVEDHGRVGKEI